MRDRGNLVISNLQQQSTYLADTGVADVYEVAFAPAIEAYTNGLHVIFKATNANTGASTLEVNGLGPKDIRKDVSTPLVSGDIFANQVVSVIYDGTNFQIVGGNTGTAVNVYNSNGSLTGDRVMTLGSYNFAIAGPNFSDYSYFDSGDVYLGMGDNTDHGFLQIAQIVNGAAGQILIESGNDTVEMEMLVNGTAHTGTWHAHVDVPATVHSHIEINETGVKAKAGTTAGTATGIDIDLNGRVGINKTAPTEKLDIVGNVRFLGALMPNNDAGLLGYKLLSGGAGSSPTWNTDTMPISSLLSATGTNSIDNNNYTQTWNWSTLTSGALLINAASTAMTNSSYVFGVVTSGNNVSSGMETRTVEFQNTHTGTSSTNVTAKFIATGGTENIAIDVSAGKVVIGGGIPDASSIIDIKSTTLGLLLPRMTKTQRDAISSPAAGLAVYQTDNTPGLRVYNGTNWMRYTETAD